ncbi:MAG: YbaK/EbsC family protein [Pseudomonadota bacterium]
MSKSLKRVTRALTEAGVDHQMHEMQTQTRTAQEAADAAGCEIDQIAKSIILMDQTGNLALFITAGGNMVDKDKASAISGRPLERADADTVRAVTGFAVGGVAPVGHKTPIEAWIDPRLLSFATVYAAGGTPRHVFSIAPEEIARLAGAREADFIES